MAPTGMTPAAVRSFAARDRDRLARGQGFDDAASNGTSRSLAWQVSAIEASGV